MKKYHVFLYDSTNILVVINQKKPIMTKSYYTLNKNNNSDI